MSDDQPGITAGITEVITGGAALFEMQCNVGHTCMQNAVNLVIKKYTYVMISVRNHHLSFFRNGNVIIPAMCIRSALAVPTAKKGVNKN